MAASSGGRVCYCDDNFQWKLIESDVQRSKGGPTKKGPSASTLSPFTSLTLVRYKDGVEY
jgi:hypothetical protein